MANTINTPTWLAERPQLGWNEKILYSIYYYFTFYGKRKSCTYTNKELGEQLGLSEKQIQYAKQKLKAFGYIEVSGISVVAKIDMASTGNGGDNSNTEGDKKRNCGDNFGNEVTKNETHNIENKKNTNNIESLKESVCKEVTDSSDNSPVAPLDNSTFEVSKDNSVVDTIYIPKYTSKKTFWDAWHFFKDSGNTTDNLQELILNARYLGIKDDLASEYNRKKKVTTTPRGGCSIPRVRMINGTEYDLVVPTNFIIPYEKRPQYDFIPDKGQIIIYIQNASQLLHDSETDSPQYTTTYLKAYIIKLRSLIAFWHPDRDQKQRDIIAIRNWNRNVYLERYKIDTLCGVRDNPAS